MSSLMRMRCRPPSSTTMSRCTGDQWRLGTDHDEADTERRSELRDGATAAQRKKLAPQEALVEELRAFLDEVKRVAPLWNPNLDDGVIINDQHFEDVGHGAVFVAVRPS